MKTAQELIAFERKLADAFERGELPYLLHLSGGNEEQLIDLFRQFISPNDWVFGTHRSHYHYLLKGGSEEKLEKLIRDGRSMFIYDAKLRFVSSSIVAGCCCMAAGVAKAIQMSGGTEQVFCFIGDAGEDEGHFYEAARLVDAQKLPCYFVVENNNRSVDSSILQRWGHLDPIKLRSWHIMRYSYTPTYPHAGTGCKQWVKFLDETPPKTWDP